MFKRENKIQVMSNMAFHLLEIKTIGTYIECFVVSCLDGLLTDSSFQAYFCLDVKCENDLTLLDFAF